MDDPQPINTRHEDFQLRRGSSLALFFNKSPGRPLLNLQYSAGLCTAGLRKTYDKIMDKNTYSYAYVSVFLSAG